MKLTIERSSNKRKNDDEQIQSKITNEKGIIQSFVKKIKNDSLYNFSLHQINIITILKIESIRKIISNNIHLIHVILYRDNEKDVFTRSSLKRYQEIDSHLWFKSCKHHHALLKDKIKRGDTLGTTKELLQLYYEKLRNNDTTWSGSDWWSIGNLDRIKCQADMYNYFRPVLDALQKKNVLQIHMVLDQYVWVQGLFAKLSLIYRFEKDIARLSLLTDASDLSKTILFYASDYMAFSQSYWTAALVYSRNSMSIVEYLCDRELEVCAGGPIFNAICHWGSYKQVVHAHNYLASKPSIDQIERSSVGAMERAALRNDLEAVDIVEFLIVNRFEQCTRNIIVREPEMITNINVIKCLLYYKPLLLKTITKNIVLSTGDIKVVKLINKCFLDNTAALDPSQLSLPAAISMGTVNKALQQSTKRAIKYINYVYTTYNNIFPVMNFFTLACRNGQLEVVQHLHSLFAKYTFAPDSLDSYTMFDNAYIFGMNDRLTEYLVVNRNEGFGRESWKVCGQCGTIKEYQVINTNTFNMLIFETDTIKHCILHNNTTLLQHFVPNISNFKQAIDRVLWSDGALSKLSLKVFHMILDYIQWKPNEIFTCLMKRRTTIVDGFGGEKVGQLQLNRGQINVLLYKLPVEMWKYLFQIGILSRDLVESQEFKIFHETLPLDKLVFLDSVGLKSGLDCKKPKYIRRPLTVPIHTSTVVYSRELEVVVNQVLHNRFLLYTILHSTDAFKSNKFHYDLIYMAYNTPKLLMMLLKDKINPDTWNYGKPTPRSGLSYPNKKNDQHLPPQLCDLIVYNYHSPQTYLTNPSINLRYRVIHGTASTTKQSTNEATKPMVTTIFEPHIDRSLFYHIVQCPYLIGFATRPNQITNTPHINNQYCVEKLHSPVPRFATVENIETLNPRSYHEASNYKTTIWPYHQLFHSPAIKPKKKNIDTDQLRRACGSNTPLFFASSHGMLIKKRHIRWVLSKTPNSIDMGVLVTCNHKIRVYAITKILGIDPNYNCWNVDPMAGMSGQMVKHIIREKSKSGEETKFKFILPLFQENISEVCSPQLLWEGVLAYCQELKIQQPKYHHPIRMLLFRYILFFAPHDVFKEIVALYQVQLNTLLPKGLLFDPYTCTHGYLTLSINPLNIDYLLPTLHFSHLPRLCQFASQASVQFFNLIIKSITETHPHYNAHQRIYTLTINTHNTDLTKHIQDKSLLDNQIDLDINPIIDVDVEPVYNFFSYSDVSEEEYENDDSDSDSDDD